MRTGAFEEWCADDCFISPASPAIPLSTPLHHPHPTSYSELAEQYGADVADNLLSRYRTNSNNNSALNLNYAGAPPPPSQYPSSTQMDSVPPLPYTPGAGTPPPAFSSGPATPSGGQLHPHHAQYASLGGTLSDGDGRKYKG
jgi:hypothetical protein